METDSPAIRSGLTPLATLRKLVRPRVVREHCALCDAGLAEHHAHLIEPATHQLVCACDACAILFSGSAETRYRRVPRDVWVLNEFQLSDAAWEALQLPINLVFFIRNSADRRVVAFYPSPAGVTESCVATETWESLAEENPLLRDLETDVEALLINRLGNARECYRLGIDECYRLAGLVRTHWRGLSGGAEVWRALEEYFNSLRQRST